ncbi:MAG TPA: enoyl-CoA hydratase [Pseudonocardia sp.]|jgi:enoyl-CoA hydratase
MSEEVVSGNGRYSDHCHSRVLDRVGLITLARPEKRNALNLELCHALRDAVTGVLADGARVVVLTGEGSSFCSGADLDTVYTAEFREGLYQLLDTVTNAPVPVIAAVNGPAIGAGTQLAIAADLRMVAPSAVFGVPTAKIGLAVDPWTIRRLALLAGNGTARALLLACDQLSAEQARQTGLAERSGSLDDALAWAAGMAELAPLTVAYNKQVLNAVFEVEFDPLTDKELFEAFEGCWASEDLLEGRRARAEKRPPRFQGR